MGGIDRRAPASPQRVLLAEDNPVNALVIAKQLRVLGYGCTVAEDGEQAWAALQEHHFVALLTDCDMPVLDGYALAMRIRATPEYAALPIIALSARPDAAQQARCLAAGMDACLSKPVSNAELVNALAGSAMPPQVHGVADSARDDLAALQMLFPNPHALAALLAQFVQTADTDLVALDRLHAAGTPETFGRMLHRFVGSLQLLNQREVAVELDQWHRSGRMPSTADFAQLRSRIRAVVERVRAWMREMEA